MITQNSSKLKKLVEFAEKGFYIKLILHFFIISKSKKKNECS
jgi:hypothetical protein